MKLAAIIVLSLFTILKITLAVSTWGSNDITYWLTFRNHIEGHGLFQIYQDIWYFNHPPFMTLFLYLTTFITPYVPNGFPFIMRLPAILADVGSVYLIYQICEKLEVCRNQTLSRILLVAGSPILLLVSGFHGNTDPVFCFIILLSTYFAIKGDSPKKVGFTLGLSLSIKVVPLIIIPTFLFFFRSKEERKDFFKFLLIATVPLFLPHTIVMQKHFLSKVFGYSSISGIWGITKLLKAALPGDLFKYYGTLGKILILFGGARLAWFSFLDVNDPKLRNELLTKMLSIGFLWFFIFSPGFGVQYLSWLSVLGVFLSVRFGFAYQIAGGAFLFSVYGFWSRWNWYYANSDEMGPWKGLASILDSVVWILILAMGLRLLSRVDRKRILMYLKFWKWSF